MPILRRLSPLAGLITLLSVSPAVAADAMSVSIESATRLTAAPALYRRVDFVVMLQARWENPYRAADVKLDLELTTPSGKTVVAPAYFERGSSGETSAWHARFAPRETGFHRGHFVLTTQGERRVSAAVEFDVAPSNDRGFLHAAGPWIFRFDSGAPFRGLGENLGWESRALDDSRHFKDLHENERYNYEYLVGTLAAHGGNFFRTWMCAWNLPLEWNKVGDTTRYRDDPGHYNASAIQRLDQLVELAAATQTYFMLALDPHGSLLDGGWTTNPYNAANGGPAATPAEFFSSPVARERYRDRLRYLVARWGYSPHLAIWEFFNEVDNAMYGQKPTRIPDEPVAAWHAEMSAYLKSLDPYQRPVTTSVSHRDVAGMAALPGIDFNQRHLYRATDTIPATIRRFVKETGKPYVIGEYSYEWDWTKNFNDFAPLMDADFKRGLWLGLFSPTPILPMTWWWEFFDTRNMPAYFARVRRVHEAMLAAGHGDYRDVSATWEGTSLAHVLAVRCGKTTFVLLQNTESTPLSGRLVLPQTVSETRLKVEALIAETNATAAAPFTLTSDRLVIPLTVPAHDSLIVTIQE